MAKYLIIVFFIIPGCTNKKTDDIQFPTSGYAYPSKIDDKKKSFLYPIHDLLSSKDSFDYCTFSEYLYNSFEEPNISLTPPEEPVFRLIYFPGFTRYTAILTLERDQITVKELKTGYSMPYMQEEQLDSQEREHFYLLQSYFPIQEHEGTPLIKKSLDSLTNLFPQLLNPEYFRKLTVKANTFGPEKFTYEKRRISLSPSKYKYFVDLINRSGYWKMKFREDSCVGQATHPNAYLLEAATPAGYNFVSYTECVEDSTKFAKACRELMKYTKVDENERLWHEQLREKLK